MTAYEAMLLHLAPASLRRSMRTGECPSVSHCAGTGRLLGEALGKAICETLDIRDELLEDQITALACLLRAFIVLDDHVKDNAIERTVNSPIHAWISEIRKEISARLRPLSKNGDALWASHEKDYTDAYVHFQKDDLFTGVVRKCCPIFLPLEIDAIPRNERGAQLEKALEEYLFCLQTMDDFRDMEEDETAPQNHNVFLVQVSPSLRHEVMNRRGALARALLPYVQRCVFKARTLVQSPTVIRHFNHSISWIENQRRSLPREKAALKFPCGIRRFRFDDDPEVRCLLTERAEGLPDSVELRAEAMHTMVSIA